MRIGTDGITQLRDPVMNPTSSNTPEEPSAWEATASFQLMIDWKAVASGGRKIGTVGFQLNIRELPKVALEQALLMLDLRVAALRCVWPSSRIQARWGGRSAITLAHGLAPHMSWLEPGGSEFLGILAREATVAGDLGFMRNLIEDIDTLRNWRRTKPDKISAANQRRIEAVNWAFHEIWHGRWFSKAGLAEHLDRAGLGTDAGNLARDIFKLPGIQATPRQPRRR
jgi:hypothetical protein